MVYFGTNGAGKTTTIRMLLGIIKKDEGQITWKGKAVDRKILDICQKKEEYIQKQKYLTN